MRKIIITALGVSLIAASTVQMAAAAEHHHHARKAVGTPASEHSWQQFRDAPDSRDWPVGNNLYRLYNEGNA
jgi:hypothetical protein